MIDPGVGYVSLSGFAGGSDEDTRSCVSDLHDRIGDLAAGGTCGRVVDLWDHDGGNMWPGLAGLAPIIGPGTVGYFIPLEGEAVPWTIEESRLLAGKETMIEVGSFAFLEPAPVLAVIIGAGTASSGEAVALSMRNRPLTRFFGRPTFGAATANTSTLRDGSLLVVTTALMADRTGKAIPMGGEISPDERTMDRQQAITAAVDWITGQHPCVP